MVMLKARLTEEPAESTTWIVNVEVPTVVGMPRIVTELVELEDNESPGGRFPLITFQVKVPVAPTSPITPIYCVPTVPTGREAVEMPKTGLTVMSNVPVIVVLATEVAVTVEVVSIEMPTGAIKVTEVEVWLVRLPGPVRLQVTPWLLTSLATLAVIA